MRELNHSVMRFLEVFLLIIKAFLSNGSENLLDCHNSKYIFFSDIKILKLGKETFKDCKNLTSLSLLQNNLSIIESSAFEGLESLFFLSINFNQIKSLNESLKSIPKLNEITLTRNKIEVIDKKFFASGLNLTKICLSANKIRVIESGAFDHLVDLKDLQLEENELTIVPAINSISIDLSHNKITKIVIGSKVEIIYIIDNQLKVIECPEEMSVNHFDAYINSLSDWSCLLKMKFLTTLSLGRNQFTYFPWRHKFSKLKYLALDDNFGTWNIGNFCGMDDLKLLIVDQLPNYKNIKNALPKLDVLQLNTDNWNCTYMKKVHCQLRHQMIQLDSVKTKHGKAKTCDVISKLSIARNNIEMEDSAFFSTVPKLNYRFGF